MSSSWYFGVSSSPILYLKNWQLAHFSYKTVGWTGNNWLIFSGPLFLHKLGKLGLKGSVQRKLRWVLKSANHYILALDCGAGHYFDFLIHHCQVLNIFPFAVSTAKLIGDFYNNKHSTVNRCPPSPIILYPLCWSLLLVLQFVRC